MKKSYSYTFCNKFLIGTIFTLLTVCFSQSEAATLHAILIGDTLGDNIQASVKKDLDNMHKEVGLISKYTHLNLHEKKITGDIITNDLLNEINKLEIEEEDIVLFYFSGHGYRETSKESLWPNLYVTNPNKGIAFDQVQELLLKKNPKFLLAMVDCCNSFIPDEYAPPQMHLKGIKATREILEQNYQKLFLEQKGHIFVSSSSIGEYSWGTSNLGGLYTYQFLLSLHKATTSPEELDWNFLLETVKYSLFGDQTPQFQINLQS